MADLTLGAGTLQGQVTVPPSKSIAHRALILSSLSGKPIPLPYQSEDLAATQDCLKALESKSAEFHCRESGSTLRFMIPLAMVLRGGGVFHRAPSLAVRPIGVYQALFTEAVFSGGEPLNISGRLKARCYTLPGDVSSQFITGLLMALPLLDEDSDIHVEEPFESMAYVKLTLHVMEAFGVQVHRPSPGSFYIQGGQHYTPCDFQIEGDYSQAAVFIAAAALGHRVTLKGLNPYSAQGDRAILDMVIKMGAKVRFDDGQLVIHPPKRLNAIDIDAAQCPDIIPIAALLQCLASGQSIITNGGRLRMKECDRLSATVETLSALGADICAQGDRMIIRGRESLLGGSFLSCRNDHRIAMLLSIAALHASSPVTLTGIECVNKSWPDYFSVFSALGGLNT